jgi:hypothetical protein
MFPRRIVDQRLNLVEVDVALERMQVRGSCVVDDDIIEGPPASSWCRRVVVKYMLPGTICPFLMTAWLMRCSAPRP